MDPPIFLLYIASSEAKFDISSFSCTLKGTTQSGEWIDKKCKRTENEL